MDTPNPQCRYTNKNTRCPGRATSATGEVLLCEAHLKLTVQLLLRLGYSITRESA